MSFSLIKLSGAFVESGQGNDQAQGKVRKMWESPGCRAAV